METEKVVRNTGEAGKGVFVDTIIPGIVTLILSAIVIYIVRAFLIKSLRRNDKMEERQKVRLVKTVTTALAILAIIIVVSGYGLQTGSLVALIGVAGLSLSLSVQGLLSNFFQAVSCLLPSRSVRATSLRPAARGESLSVSVTSIPRSSTSITLPLSFPTAS